MMKRETLKNERSIVNKMSYHPTVQTVRQLLDSHLEALDIIDQLRAQLNADGVKEAEETK